MSRDQDSSSFLRRLDMALFAIVALIIVVIIGLLLLNLYFQYNNYTHAIDSTLKNSGFNYSLLVLGFSRAFDFAVIKTSTLFIGFILAMIGALYLLRVVDTSYSIGAEGKGLKANFQTTSPGLVLATLGVITIVCTLFVKSFVNMDSTDATSQSPKAADSSTTAKTPLPIDIIIDDNDGKLSNENLKTLELTCRDLIKNNVASVSIETSIDSNMSIEGMQSWGQRQSAYLKRIISEHCGKLLTVSLISYGKEKPVLSRGKNKITIIPAH